MKEDNPCYGCPKRYVGCHSNCKDRDDYREKEQQKKNLIKASRKQDRVFDAYFESKVKRLYKISKGK